MVIQHLYNFRTLLQQCKSIEIVISSQMEILTFKRSMPSQHGMVIQTLHTTGNATLSTLIAILLQE